MTGAPVLVLKLVVDGTYLSLANQQQHGDGSGYGGHGSPGTTAGHHVCVVEMEWFEMTLRLCDNSLLGEADQKVRMIVMYVCVKDA